MHGLHAHEHAPQTQGRTLHWAKYYDVTVQLLTLGQSKKLRAWTIDAANIRAGETILDVGCGTGELTLLAKRAAGTNGRIYGIDASPEMIEFAREKAAREKLDVEFRLEPIEHLTFADNSMDVVLSSLMMHHLPGDLKRAGLQEIYRVLKPGGRVVIVDLKRAASRVEHIMSHFMAHGGMARGLQDLVALMQALGFVSVEFTNTRVPMLGMVRGEKRA
ncbi:MAG: class I SAM-dependent methyltransferase [Chloroflexi bacterium]|nr:class I SAM-dependent methyltransferase [Chloroflexota bacterium]